MMPEPGTTVSHAVVAFRDRAEAGRRLAESLGAGPDPDAAVLAVPRGGVPVAEPLATALGVPVDLVFVRKLPIPSSPEAGFGAVALDGSVVLNEPLIRLTRIPRTAIDPIVEEVLSEVRRRATEYAGHDRPPAVHGKRVYLVDDGLASGYTMIAAAKMVRRQGPERVALCVPVSPVDSIRRVEEHFDEVHCLIRQTMPPFAVASFYADFRDLSDREVGDILQETRESSDGRTRDEGVERWQRR